MIFADHVLRLCEGEETVRSVCSCGWCSPALVRACRVPVVEAWWAHYMRARAHDVN